MADKSGQSVPDKTNSDNPSETGKPSVNSQTSGAEQGSVQNDNGSVTHTRKYGSDAQTSPTSRSNVEGETADEFAERGVVERHGEAIRQNPQFKELVKEEKRQIQENADNTKGM